MVSLSIQVHTYIDSYSKATFLISYETFDNIEVYTKEEKSKSIKSFRKHSCDLNFYPHDVKIDMSNSVK